LSLKKKYIQEQLQFYEKLHVTAGKTAKETKTKTETEKTTKKKKKI